MLMVKHHYSCDSEHIYLLLKLSWCLFKVTPLCSAPPQAAADVFSNATALTVVWGYAGEHSCCSFISQL